MADQVSEVIAPYFPNLTDEQIRRFDRLIDLYSEWNSRINVVSRKDIDQLAMRHVLHSLAIAKLISFKPGASIMDLGTGGGFPGIPLAILFPEVSFLLTDSIAKKIRVVQEVADALELKNVRAVATRSEKVQEQFDFVVTRAVAPMSELALWCKGKFFKMYNHELKNGIIALKGGDLTEELKPFGKKVKQWPLEDLLPQAGFEEKVVVYLPMI